jgi:hypothetical protein
MTLLQWAIGLSALCAILAMLSAWARGRQLVLAQGRADLQQFGRSAIAIIEDKAMPESVAAFVAKLGTEAGNPRIAMWLGMEILKGRTFERPGPPANEGAARFRTDLDRLSDEQKQALAQCIAYFMMSSAAAHQILAVYLRRIIYFGLFEYSTRRVKDVERTRAIVLEYSSMKMENRRNQWARAKA